MQSTITVLILLTAIAYIFFKWMPRTLREKVRSRLSVRHPRLASYFEGTVKKCASSCSSSCNSCETSTIVNRDVVIKPINFIRKT